MRIDIPYYEAFISSSLKSYLLKEAQQVPGVEGLVQIGEMGGLETPDSLRFVCELYDSLKDELNQVLRQRTIDREFIDQRTKACFQFNKKLKRSFESSDYQTVLGLTDSKGRIVIGPKNKLFCRRGGGQAIGVLPPSLQGYHVTLFGPPDNVKLSINAMNAFHRQLKNEPQIISDLLRSHHNIHIPKWGADNEDSKTPLRADFISAGENLTNCCEGKISYVDESTNKVYKLEKDHLSLPIKRFPGLALPCTFLFYKENPLPLHLYDFALHFFRNWANPQALNFYVPKLENEEEAKYIRLMVETAEKMVKQRHPSYQMGTIRLIIVLENPRAILRVNEMMDELYPYFAGASLGWHDYLASTARLFKEDGHYQIPVKTDPDIVIKYIKTSHDLLTEVVASRGGINIGGMYGVLPTTTDLGTPSFQVAMKGFIKDVLIQMKRGLSGFWVAHPDFVRIGLALVEAWSIFQKEKGEQGLLKTLIKSLLHENDFQQVWDFITGPDIEGALPEDPLYTRTLIVADSSNRESAKANYANNYANNDPEEIGYNVFQTLQYLTDWLSGRGCVALPAEIAGIPVRVMDDLATAERSRWEVWHEIYHGRFALEEFLKIVMEEMHFIRKDVSSSQNEKEKVKIVQVKWDERTEKWYPIAMKLMVVLMTDPNPVEFATELLLPFTISSIRNSANPWEVVREIHKNKYHLNPKIERFLYYFEMCGSLKFATTLSSNLIIGLDQVKASILQFDRKQILEAAAFHGDIGESKKTLDGLAKQEQSLVLSEDEKVKTELRKWGHNYQQKFAMKFLISAKGKTGGEIVEVMKKRYENSLEEELKQARLALWEITHKRMMDHPLHFHNMNNFNENLEIILKKHQVRGAMISVCYDGHSIQTLCLGNRDRHQNKVTPQTWFQMASLSKTVASLFALEYFKKEGLALSTSVNELLNILSSSSCSSSSSSSLLNFKICSLDSNHPEWADQVTLRDLLRHTALNMHYVNGLPLANQMPKTINLLSGENGYTPIGVINPPGKIFQYSGGGFLVLEYLLEALSGQSIYELTRPFLDSLGLQENDFSFEPWERQGPGVEYAHGFKSFEEEIPGRGHRLMFPAFAAGSLGTAPSIHRLLIQLTEAYHNLKGCGPISHDTAVEMLTGSDQGSGRFMGCQMGLGVFTAEAGDNRLMIHQGANDGFRALFIHCYHGPDYGKGFVLLCNGELNGVLFNAEVAQLLLKALAFQGIDEKKFQSQFTSSTIPQEEVVNIGYKKLIFDAFCPTLPEDLNSLQPSRKRDPLAPYNLAVGAKILEVSNQKFARAENLVSEYLPQFDPEIFGKQGKIMDSWESVRHNQRDFDHLIFELSSPSPIHYISISTQYHLGNQPEFIKILGQEQNTPEWYEILPKVALEGHALKCLRLTEKQNEQNVQNENRVFSKIHVLIYPDGGLTRLGLYTHDLPEQEGRKFLPLDQVKSIPFPEKIPSVVKPLHIPYQVNEKEIKLNFSRFKKGEEIDVASAALGGKVVKASNEHYGPAIQVISPYAPINMFDGLESARSRVKDHTEELIIGFSQARKIHRIEMDFTYFVNNNPLDVQAFGRCEVKGKSEIDWREIIPKTRVKTFAGNKKSFSLATPQVLTQIKVVIYPDGGMNRIHVYSFAE